MKDLKEARLEINRIDSEIAKLFQERMTVCEDITRYKMANGLSIRDKDREAALINRNRALITRSEIESYYVQFLQNTIDLSCRYQERLMEGMKVAYSGVEGAFAYIAAKRMFPHARLTSFPSFAAAYEAVEKGDFDCTVLPIENSYAGEVGPVMDLMFSGSLYINQVTNISIKQNLLAVPGATLDDIKTVVSHPQALGQCSKFIEKHGLDTLEYVNTAVAAKYVKDLNDKSVAAIASDEAAELFGLNILESDINDDLGNSTRFAVFSRVQNRPEAVAKRDDESFIIVFTVKNEAGCLAQTLDIIGAHGFNMKSLQSRPMKGLSWEYYFYIEAEGNIFSENGSRLLKELSAICAKLKLVGAYYANK